MERGFRYKYSCSCTTRCRLWDPLLDDGIMLTARYFVMTRLHTNTQAAYVVLSLALIGFRLGLIIKPASNLVMNPMARTKQGMISCLTGLARSAPLTFGIAFLPDSSFRASLRSLPTTISRRVPGQRCRLNVLSAGFDCAFCISFLVGIMIILIDIAAREEVNSDYLNSSESGTK